MGKKMNQWIATHNCVNENPDKYLALLNVFVNIFLCVFVRIGVFMCECFRVTRPHLDPNIITNFMMLGLIHIQGGECDVGRGRVEDQGSGKDWG